MTTLPSSVVRCLAAGRRSLPCRCNLLVAAGRRALPPAGDRDAGLCEPVAQRVRGGVRPGGWISRMSPSRPPGTARPGGAGAKPSRDGEGARGAVRLGGHGDHLVVGATETEIGEHGGHRLGGDAVPGRRRGQPPVGAEGLLALVLEVRQADDAQQAGGNRRTARLLYWCGGGGGRARARTVRYPVPCCCHAWIHRSSTQRICSRSVSGSVRSSAKARGSACSASSSSRSSSPTGVSRRRRVVRIPAYDGATTAVEGRGRRAVHGMLRGQRAEPGLRCRCGGCRASRRPWRRCSGRGRNRP